MMAASDTGHLIPSERIEGAILVIRGKKVMLSHDLAALYGVEPRAVVQAVKRSLARFPDDFVFQLTPDEWRILKSQSVISSWGGARATPYAFTEQGVAMLSSVLRSPRAVQVNVGALDMRKNEAHIYSEFICSPRDMPKGLMRGYSFPGPVT
jgi:hypothetical protein